MIPRELSGTAIVPGGGEELQQFRHGGEHMIVFDRNEHLKVRTAPIEKWCALV